MRDRESVSFERAREASLDRRLSQARAQVRVPYLDSSTISIDRYSILVSDTSATAVGGIATMPEEITGETGAGAAKVAEAASGGTAAAKSVGGGAHSQPARRHW